MQLSAIDIEGFKSFAKKTHLAFKPGITAIIGPNGSGKSNVTEAIRWVLGEQSIKQLRGKESTDIIFHGTKDTPARGRARVTLTFSNESGRFPGGSAEVAIGRSLSRDGESRYLVNGDDVRLLDLQRSLAEGGIGARTFTVISQGMVDRYLTATAHERKELFDEATGVRALQIQLLEAHRKLQKTQQHALEIETIIQELAPRLAVLGRQVKRYEIRKSLAQAHAQKQSAWFYHTWHALMGQAHDTQAHIEQLRSTIAQARTRRQQLERSLFAQKSDTATASVRQQLVQTEADFIYQQDAYTRNQKQRAELEASIVDIAKQRNMAEARLAQARKHSLQFDWIAKTESILERCTVLLKQFVLGNAARDQAESLQSDIESHLHNIRQIPAAQTTKLMMQTIETPLQEVARLTAIEEERRAQLTNVPTVSAPTKEAIQRLAAQLAALTPTSKSDEGGSVTALDAVREQELEAERAASAAGAALDQIRQEIAEVESEILREQGSAFLQTIQTASADAFPEKPSDDELRTLAQKLATIGEPDPLVHKEFAEAQERHDHLTHQLSDVREAAINLVDLMGNLHKQMQQQFAERFAIIRQAFSEIFTQLFGGGQAHISQTEEGIEISVMPPGKRSRHVTLLSGGERALTSLALLMAILEAHKPPFIVLDEVDAALDEANSRRFALLIKERCQNTQCIVVTHNREVMSVADVLYGVTMAQEGVSSVYSVQLTDVVETDPASHTTSFSI